VEKKGEFKVWKKNNPLCPMNQLKFKAPTCIRCWAEATGRRIAGETHDRTAAPVWKRARRTDIVKRGGWMMMMRVRRQTDTVSSKGETPSIREYTKIEQTKRRRKINR
jgi:hypothetical protein